MKGTKTSLESFFIGLKVKNTTTYKGPPEYVEVLVNPPRSDLTSLYKEYDNSVRIGIDKKDNIYVWNPYILHSDIDSHIPMIYKFEYSNRLQNDMLISNVSKNIPLPIPESLLERLKYLFPKIEALTYGDKVIDL